MTDHQPERDEHGLIVLDEDRCWELLSSEPVGRLGYVRSGRPQIVPLNHAVDDQEILLVTTPGSKVHAALQEPGIPAVYEVDDYDEDGRVGWSVIVEGRLEPVLDEVVKTRLDRGGFPAWVDVFHDRRWLVLRTEKISGRRVPPAEDDESKR